MTTSAAFNDQPRLALAGSDESRNVETPRGGLLRVELVGIEETGLVLVRDIASGGRFMCEVLESGPLAPSWSAGDRLLVLSPVDDEPGIIVGRIGRMTALGAVQREVVIEATHRIALRCGEASIQMAGDGKVVVRGEDVMLRARGTQRIRAATVAIN